MKGRVAIVTGSSSGIGRAVAQELSGRGMSVVVTSRSQERAAATAAALGERALGVAAELTDPAGPLALVECALEQFGRLDVLVNNAGAGQVADSETLDPAEWQRIIDIDLTAPFLCAQAAARPMLAAGSGVIVNISSLTGHIGLARRAAYTAAKHGIEGLTKTLGVEWAPRGVRVVSVSPAYVATELLAGTSKAGGFTLDDVAGRTPLRRLAEPEEVARVVAFLASDDASFITGSTVLVDGGWLADGGWEHARG
jgi:NAD(P)-dependent dehydrogenase (short-subunit alcohol dehydrogenase family)